MRDLVRHSACLLALPATLSLIPAVAAAPQSAVLRTGQVPVWGTALRLVEEIRIGALDGAEEYVFGDVMGLAVGRDGVMFVADRQVPIIRMYDSKGRFVRNVGGRGAGPGEFNAIGGIRTFPDGRLALWDNRNRRITVYTPAGDLAQTHSVQSGLFASDVFQVDRTGTFYVRTVTAHRPEPASFDEGWIRVSPSGRIIDTVLIPKDSTQESSFVLAGASGYDRPFSRQLLSTVSSLGYLISGSNETYAFDLHRAGATPIRIERPYTPLRVRGEERAEWEAWARSFERRANAPPSDGPRTVPLNPRRVSYAIPDLKPAYSDLRTDSQGRIWVRRYVEAQSRPGPARPPGDDRPRRVWREPLTFDVFDVSGTLAPDRIFLGTVTLPWNAYMYEAADRHIWATVLGEADEEYVVRLRIESVPR